MSLGVLILLSLTLVATQATAGAAESRTAAPACGDSFSVTGIRWSDVSDVFTPGVKRVTFRVNLVDVNRFLNGANGSSQTIVADSRNTEFLGPYELPPSGNSVADEFITTDFSTHRCRGRQLQGRSCVHRRRQCSGSRVRGVISCGLT